MKKTTDTKNTARAQALTMPSGSGFTYVELMIVVVIFGLLGMLVWGAWYENAVELPKAYESWVKLTGNEKELTFEEWKSLNKATKPEGDTVLFIR